MCVACLAVFLALSVAQLLSPDVMLWKYIKIPVTVVGIVSGWLLYDVVVGENFVLARHRLLGLACSFTFFIYLFHEPTLNIVRKLIVAAIGKNSVGYFVSYFVSPWIFVACAVVLGMVLRKYCGKGYGVCVGGR